MMMRKPQRERRIKAYSTGPAPTLEQIGLMTWDRALSFAAAGNGKHVDVFRQEPFYVLFGHAIELGLKSFLYLKGVAESECQKQLGHDLEKAAHRARSMGLQISDIDLVTVAELTDCYGQPYSFRYFVADGPFARPSLKATADCCGRVLAAVREQAIVRKPL
jgi:hypothetical protein